LHLKFNLTNYHFSTNTVSNSSIAYNGTSVWKKDNDLYIFYSQVGDAPKQILYTKVDISSKSWDDWKAEPPQISLKPELDWEGANEKITPSMRGEMDVKVNQLRDPAIFEENGQFYLLYTGEGEQAIGIAQILEK